MQAQRAAGDPEPDDGPGDVDMWAERRSGTGSRRTARRAPDPVGAAAYNGIMDSYAMIVTARSNRDLKPQEWDRQKAMIKSVMNWDQATWTWWARPSSSHPEHVADVLNTLFEAARVYGTAVTVEMVPGPQADEPAVVAGEETSGDATSG